MRFHEKLDFLMNITKTTNSSLSLYTSIDPSYISRLRRGERIPPKNDTCVKAMSGYFARSFSEEYQRKTFFEATGITIAEQENYESHATLIQNWLLEDRSGESSTVKKFLNEFTTLKFGKPPQSKQEDSYNISAVPASGITAFYGTEGKREAVIALLSMVINSKTPQTLLLFSDEDIEWLAGDRQFILNWTLLMSRIIMKGHKIKIIHTVSRDLDEMLAAINQWMPLYVTGAIEPFYYPKKRDGIFRRTLFIAPDTAAVTSSAVGNMGEAGVNFVITEKKAIKSLSEEYNNYLALCKPMTYIFTQRDKEKYRAALLDFEKVKADTIIQTESLSLMTMPCAMVEGIAAKLEAAEKEQFLKYYEARFELFRDMLDSNSFIEIIEYPGSAAVKSGRVRVDMCPMLGCADIYYTAEDYKQHLENIISLLKSHDNFNICLLHDSAERGHMAYVKEDVGFMVSRTLEPPIFLAMNESNITAAFWDYLNGRADRSKDSEVYKRNAINMLYDIIESLEKTTEESIPS
ncbi:MAG: transcriptional regulator [Clostridiales bacterium]|nr:transcriptional regulator [Clostridiales bacterium]